MRWARRDHGSDLNAIGRPPRSTPEYNGGGGVRFTMPGGMLGGVVFTLGVTYSSDSYFVAPTTGGRDTNADGFLDSNDGRRELKSPGYTVWNGGVSYQFRTGGLHEKKLTHRLQLNAKNLLDQKYVDMRMVPARRL